MKHAETIAGFLLGLEDGDDTMLWNVGYFQRTTRPYIPENGTVDRHRCENLKYNMKIYVSVGDDIFVLHDNYHLDYTYVIWNRAGHGRRAVFARSKAWIVGSNPTQGIDVKC
jgi:hypothetical protein